MIPFKKSVKKFSGQGSDLFSTHTKVLLTMLIGLTLGIVIAIGVNSFYQTLLIQRIKTFAVTVDAQQVGELTDQTRQNEETSYAQIKARLADLKGIYADAHFVYLMGKHNDEVYFLADSESVNDAGFSPRGEVYDDASQKLKEAFDTKLAFVEGPVSDDYGNWYSALAPIIDEQGNVVAVIGVDVPAKEYFQVISWAVISPIVFALALSVIIIVFDRLKKRRLETMRFQSELVSIASHELRTPLNGIRWGEETLMTIELNELQKKVISSMYDSTLRLQESIEEILQLASIGAARSKQLTVESGDLRQAMHDVLQTQQLPAQQKGLHLDMDKSWPEHVMADVDIIKMRRVFNNIVSNAIKYTRPDTVVTISYKKYKGKHIITIADKGIGVPAEEKAHIFDGFYRATNAVKSAANGTGMGLYLSRSVVVDHGGSLHVESEENVGTTVCIELPVANPVLKKKSDVAKSVKATKDIKVTKD